MRFMNMVIGFIVGFIGVAMFVAMTTEKTEKHWAYLPTDDSCVINMNAPVTEQNERFIACAMAREEANK